jgi:hypothetical protein
MISSAHHGFLLLPKKRLSAVLAKEHLLSIRPIVSPYVTNSNSEGIKPYGF